MTMQTADLDELTRRIELGERVSDDEIERLAELDILALGLLADTARRRQGMQVGYRRVLQLNEWTPGALPQAFDADEVRLTVLPSSIQEIATTIRQIRSAVPASCRVTGGSCSGLLVAAEGRGGLVRQRLAELRGAGLDDLDEWPIDDEREDPGELLRWGHEAGLLVRRLTVTFPMGETRVLYLLRARAAIESTAAPVHLAPLPQQPPNEVPTTGYDNLRSVALARLSVAHLANAGRHVGIEVDWSTYGPKLAQVALLFGADHLDAVPAVDEAERGPRRQTVAEIERHIRAAGFEPRRAANEHE